MRLIKAFGLAAVAAVVAMAFVAATSASAANTQLCNTHTALTCGSAATTVSMENLGTGVLKGSEGFKVKCDSISASATPLGLGNPQSIHVFSLSVTSCETSENDPCEVGVHELPLANLSKTGLDGGVLAATNGTMIVLCEDVYLWFDMECEFDFTGLAFPVGAQHLTALETPISYINGVLCPNAPTLTGLLTTTVSNRYVLA